MTLWVSPPAMMRPPSLSSAAAMFNAPFASGATPVPADEEIGRVLPVVSALAEAGVVVSIDTMRAECAAVAVRAGASVVNDVSGGLADPGMYATVAELGVPYVAMHWRGPSATMSSLAQYDDDNPQSNPDDTGYGQIIPTLAVDQYSATLARWFGVDAGGIADIFPNLGRFPGGGDLGFMR